MDERQLKSRFWSSLKAGHLKNNTVIPRPEVAELRIVEEANFRSFDLVIAAIARQCAADKETINAELLARTHLLSYFAQRERCRADRIRFYPMELKSDNDRIDERLPNQIVDAILTFGHSFLVLDKDHSKRVKNAGLDRILPATIICYTGVDDYFEVISVFDRFVSCGVFDFESMNIARLLYGTDGSTATKVYRRLQAFQKILQKIVFSQLHFTDPGLDPEELRFIGALADIELPNRRKIIASILKESANTKMTDYV
jgi:hypothetical protein